MIPIKQLKTCFESEHVPMLIEGRETHEAVLRFVAQNVAYTTDEDRIEEIVAGALPKNYSGNSLGEIKEMVRGALRKGFGKTSSAAQLGSSGYDPGEHGPLPLGYTQEGSYVFVDQARQILILASASQLLSLQFLLGLRPFSFWVRQFPKEKNAGVDFMTAGQVLMEECRRKGPFDPRRVRGRGLWLEDGEIIVNLGSPIPAHANETYICFEPLPIKSIEAFDVERLQKFLERFIWRDPHDAVFLLGWLAIAPICGVLSWRPHCFVYGPPNCGKSTLHATASNLLRPLGLAVDGQSSEAGIRQQIKADSRPCIIDEFESDHVRGHIAGVLRLARSASSAEAPVLRGTPEGKAMHFTLRTCFFFAAVNPGGMSPADATRILLLEMLKHENDREIAASISEDEAYFTDKGPEFCGYMAGLAHLIPPAIEMFKQALPGIDSRHRQNVATLFAGYFVAISRAVPTDAQAQAVADEYKPSVALHAEAFERDDAEECLQYLFAYVVEKHSLGTWLAAARADKANELENTTFQAGAQSIPRNFDIVVRIDGSEPGVFIRNGSPAVEAVFRETKWAQRAWEKSLRKLEGYFAPRSPVHFANAQTKSRAIGLPLELLPDIDFEVRSNGGGRDY